MEAKTIDFKVNADNCFYHEQRSKKEIYLFIELKGSKITRSKDRIPVNLSLVIDRSGSMEGDKLKYAKDAMEFVIKNLNANDSVSVVQYDNVVEVVASSAKLKNKELLYHKIRHISARNNTNLSGGMLEGYQQVNSSKEKGVVNRVLLLSDGLANEGITDEDQLQDIARYKFSEEGIALSSFGVGADFNENLMTKLAEYGGGNYYFIGNPDKIPEIFAQELDGLLAVVAQNNQVEINFPSDTVKFSQSYGYPCTTNGDRLLVNFNDIFSEEGKAVLLKFDVIQAIEHEIHFDCSLSYDDVNLTLKRVSETARISIQAYRSEEDYSSEMNLYVLENIAFYLSNLMYEAAMQEIDMQNFEKAKEIIEETKSFLRSHLNQLNQSERLNQSLVIIEEYENKLENMRSMDRETYTMSQKGVKYLSYLSRQRK